MNRILALAIATLAFGALVGCNSGPGKPESIATEEKVSKAVEMRQMFDKVGGDWNKLTADEQKQFTEFAGDAQKAEFVWYRMGHPGATDGPGGSGAPSSAGPAGPR
ncbi:MAG: hypothetical protein KIS66_01795 [Fimbriimonadaceae bacterium]|nr:hypothetical protein [Fimbriimonadaceae bacterium]